MARNRYNNISKTIKDYTVPFVWLLLILVLLYSVFSTPSKEVNNLGDSEATLDYSNSQVTLSPEDSIAYIVYDSWKKVQIETKVLLWKLEKVVVESWNVVINFPFVAKMKLSENWEFSYKEDWSFYLESGDLWVEASKDIEVSMKYANAYLSIWSVSNLKQNEIESNLYSISWNTSISNLAWISAKVQNGSKLHLKIIDSTSTDVDLSSMEQNIDDYFKLSSWFKDNKWEELLIIDAEEKPSLSWSLLIEKDTLSLLSFDDIADESYVNSNSIDLRWRYSPLKVWGVTINGKKVVLNKELWIFSLKWITLPSITNDLIIKLFDNNKNIIWKRVFTIYSSNPIPSKTSTKSTSSKGLENYAVKPTDFIIYEPTKTWKLTTTSSRITIRGKVTNKDVSSVSINDYTLKSYNGSTWRYHAFEDQETIKDWANNYEVKYKNKDLKVIYKEYYSIYKAKSVSPEVKTEKETKLISPEVKID